MNTTWYQIRAASIRGRGETITLAIFLSFFPALFFGLVFQTGWAALAAAAVTIAVPVWVNRKRRRLSAATLGLNAAYRSISTGKLLEAEELLRTVESLNRDRWAQRLTMVQRALIEIRRGDLTSARADLDLAIDLPDDGRFKQNTAYQIEGAHAMRAFVRAGLGDREGALEDVAWVRALASPSPEALARATLAEAMVLERAGEREALRTLLDSERTLLLEHTHPRERAIVRAYQRMLKVSQSSVYRERAPDSAASGDEPELDDWVARVAPGALNFMRKGKRKLTPEQAAYQAQEQNYRIQDAHRKLNATVQQAQYRQPFIATPGQFRNTASRSQRNVLLLFGVIGAVLLLIGGAYVLPQLFAWLSGAGAHASGLEDSGGTNAPLIGMAIGTLALGGTTFAFLKRRHRRRLQHEQLAPARRQADASARSSELDIDAITSGPDDVAAAQGHMMVAMAAEKRGEWVLVLQECDKALGRLWLPDAQAKADILFPDLQALRAFALACLGRYADADMGLRSLGNGYPHFERAIYRVQLVELLQGVGPREAATHAEAYAAELPLSVREELLTDLVRVVANPESAGLGEMARLREELEKTDHGRAWVASICPQLLQAFHGAEETDVSSLGRQHTEAEAEAEAEVDLTNHPARVLFAR